ncbi:hypothetical protein ACWGS9_20395 [Bradyrhizobium sp. Arg314]
MLTAGPRVHQVPSESVSVAILLLPDVSYVLWLPAVRRKEAAQFAWKKDRRTNAAKHGLAYAAHVVDMKVDKFAEGFQARYTGLGRRLTAIDLALGFGCPAPCVVPAKEGPADVATFATDLDTPGAGREFCAGGHFFVCAPVCAEKSKRGEKRRILA